MDCLSVLTLLQIPGLGRRSVEVLAREAAAGGAGRPEDLPALARRAGASLAPAPGQALAAADWARAAAAARQIAGRCREAGYALVTPWDAAYPARLRNIPDRPVLLYVRGNLDALAAPLCVAVIGTRRPSGWGRRAAFRLGELLARRGVPVVSGLALGCDTAAHQGALAAGGFTAATLPTGLDAVYPPANRQLAEAIVKAGGALLSEYPPGEGPAAYRFVERDRLQSGLSDAVVVVETEVDGGAMYTAAFTVAHGRQLLVCAAGPAAGPAAGGNRKLLADGVGTVLASIDDLPGILGI